MNQPLSFIHPQAKVADNVVIEPFTTINKDVEIDEGTWIGPNVTIMEGARIGKNCKIHPGSVISGVPQDLKFSGEKTMTVIGDNTVIREFVTISRGTVDKHKTVIGSNSMLMAYVHVAHDCQIGDNVILVNSVQVAGHCVVENYAIVGGASALHQFVRVGAHSMIAGGSLVRKDVPPYVTAAREPLSYSGINSIGLRRRGFSNKKINEIQEIYRQIYMKGQNNNKALDIIQIEMKSTKERDEIINFIRNSNRGIMRGYSNKL